jgi:lysophospholipase L1-like esterase
VTEPASPPQTTPGPIGSIGSIGSFVAVGDSFTEGMNDIRPDGSLGGWADRLAVRLAEASPGLRYANLAVRGKLLDQIVAEQLDTAIAMRPDLVALSAGGNDLMRPGADPDELAERYEAAVARFADAGAQVLVFAGADSRGVPLLQRMRGKVAIYNEHLRAIALRRHCIVVDLWALRSLRDARAWSEDRIHLSPEGHERVALLAAQALGLPLDADPFAPWPAQEALTRGERRRADILWAREYVAPWVGRRLRKRSSGDGMTPKRPELEPVRADTAVPSASDAG